MRILIADSDGFSRETLNSLLTGLGHQVTAVEDGLGACAVLERKDPPPLAILDWFLPNMDSLAAVRRIRARTVPIPTYLIMLSGMDSETGLVQALEAGADEYMLKPLKVTELQARIKVAERVTRLQAALSGRVQELEDALTGRNLVEDALRRNEERFRRFFSTVPEPLWGFDTRTLRILEVNDAAVNQYGYSREEFLSMRVTDVWDDRCPDSPADEGISCSRGQLAVREARHRTKDGSVIDVEVFWSELDRGVSHVAVASVHDVTEKKRLELDLRHSQKLESIGQLAAGVAHEINTPIQYVGDNCRFLDSSFRDMHEVFNQYQKLLDFVKTANLAPELIEQLERNLATLDIDFLIGEIPQAISQSIDGVDRVAQIVRAMKEFSHPGSEKKELVDLNHAIQNTLIVSRNESKYVADVVADLDPTLPLVRCLIGEINQVILNLVVNAAHAIADVKKEGQRGTITVSTSVEGDYVCMSVGDNGTGIPLAVRNRIFDPFFTTKEVGRGTGQGLALARNAVVKKHGGTLTYETEENVGTTFLVRIPIDCDRKQRAVKSSEDLRILADILA